MGSALPEGYKDSLAGVIPNEWSAQAIGDSTIEVIDGDRGTHYPKQTDFLDEGFCLFLSAKNVTKNGFSFNECQFISAEKDGALRKGKLSKSDLVITTRGTVGNVAFYNDLVPFSEMRINSGMAIIRVSGSTYSSSYIYKLLNSPLIESQLSKVVFGSAQPQLTIKVINELVIPTPPLPEQKKIARILSTVDSKLALIDQQITATQTLKKGLMQKLFSEGVGTQDDSSRKEGNWQPHTEFKDSELGRIPAGWDVSPLGKVASLQGGFAFKSSDRSETGVKWLKIANVTKGKVEWDTCEYLPESFLDQHKDFCLNEGDIVMALTRPLLQDELKIARITEKDKNSLLNQRVGRFLPHHGVSTKFLYCLLRSTHFVEAVAKAVMGTDPPNVSTKQVDAVIVAIPPVDEQDQIANILITADRKLVQLTTQKTQTEQLKKGLMQKLLTGQIRVKPDPQDH